jgi:hypothetical protein
VRIADSAWRQIPVESIEEYVSEVENPSNTKNVTAIEVFLPSPLLAEGMCLVDTPGIESVFEANAKATQEFVPRTDAALVVLGADPPVSAGEVALIERMRQHVGAFVFVMNKADRVTAAELAAAKNFTYRILAARLHEPVEVFEISARTELENANAQWEWDRLRSALEGLSSKSGRHLTRVAQRRAGERLANRLLRLLQDRREALLMPMEEAEGRMRDLAAHLNQLQYSILDIGWLLKAEQDRSFRALEARRDEFLAASLPAAEGVLNAKLRASTLEGSSFRRHASDVALDIAREHVEPWLASEEKTVEDDYSRTIKRFSSIVEEYLRLLASPDIPQLAHLADVPVESGQLTAPSHFHFHKLLHIGRPASPVGFIADLVLRAVQNRGPIERDTTRFLQQLMETNASRVEADLTLRLEVARREVELAVRRRLVEVREVAEEVLQRTRDVTAAGATAVKSELERLALLELEANEIVRQLSRE